MRIKKMSANGVKVLKSCHLVFVMVWVVGVVAMAVLTLMGVSTGSELHTSLRANRFIDDVLVIPGAVLTIITAIVYGAYTNWGFFKHRWITVKWIVSILVILVGTFYFSPLLDKCLVLADEMGNGALSDGEMVRDLRIISVGSFLQAGILLFLVVLSVFKPWKRKKSVGGNAGR